MSAMTRHVGEQGAVAVVVAVALVPILLGAAVLGVDLARLQLAAQDAQRAADAAALAGVIHLPGDPSTAVEVAAQAAVANGVTADQITSAPLPGAPTRLQVKVSGIVRNAFAGLFGVPEQRITRRAVADFARPLVLGSPCNVIGNEDMPAAGGGLDQQPVGVGACDAVTGRSWVGIMGPDTNKEAGDAVASRWCVWGPGDTRPDGCSAAGFGPRPPGDNLEYRPGGYTYVVRVTKPGILRLQGYDLGWVATGSFCEGVRDGSGRLVNPLIAASAVRTNEYVTTVGPGSNPRYAPGSGPFCAGDTHAWYPYADSSSAGLAMATTFQPLRPGPSPWSEAGGVPLCPATTLAGFSGLTTDLAAMLRPGVGGAAGAALRRTFHRWADLCPAVQVQPGDYTVKVRTGAGGGSNRFALRAWLAGQSGGVAVMASQRMQVFANMPAGGFEFHAVRLDSSAAGRTLEVGVFDLGDALSAMRVELLAPDTHRPIESCEVLGAVQARASPCSVSTTRSVSNARWILFRFTMPSGYRCRDDTEPSACWLRARITAPAAQADTTTWVATMVGDPVRLVN